MLDIYTDMHCVSVNTAQNFPNYGKMLFKEDVINVTKIASPIAKFGETERASSVSGEYKSTNESEYLQNVKEEMITETSSTQTNHKVPENGPIIGKLHTVYKKNSGICIRPQLFPDAVKHVNLFDNFYKQK